jgi:hypothetical protein
MSSAEIISELDRLSVCLCSGLFDEKAVASRLREIAKTLKSTTTTTNQNQKTT